MKLKITMMMSAAILLATVGIAGAQGVTQQTLLPGALIPKFMDPLPVATTETIPGITVVDATDATQTDSLTGVRYAPYTITMREFQAYILPSVAIPLPPPAPAGAVLPANTSSSVWGYLTTTDSIATPRPSYLGPVVLAKKGVETRPTYINALPFGADSMVQQLLPTDQTIDWAAPFGTCTQPCQDIYLGPQPAVPHIHGGEVAPLYDGGPDAWWLPVNLVEGGNVVGSGSPAVAGAGQATFIYPTQQQAGTIWFHDHALGITRLNVYAGMAGLYPIFDPGVELPKVGEPGCSAGAICLPAFPQYDIPLIIQDRSFDTNGQIFYNLASNPQPNPLVHPFWIPEFIGDAIVVNGKTWPFLDVEPRQYRFRFVNGSNARFYDLRLDNGSPFIVIATDDGYLDTAVSTSQLTIGPGERYEVIVDFTGQLPGTNIIMRNQARTPFPGGGKVVSGTTDMIMQFRVSLPLSAIPNTAVVAGTVLRPNNPIVNIKNVVPVIKRQLTLNEVASPLGPLELVLNNTKYNGILTNYGFTTRDTEQPAVGDTELWEIINISADAHPIHTHLASFQIVNRQVFENGAKKGYTTAYAAIPGLVDAAGPPFDYLTPNADGAIGGNPAIGPYLKGQPKPPLPYENGWKDTAIMYPGEVTRIMIRWAPTDAPAVIGAGGAQPQLCGPCGLGAGTPACVTPCVPGPGSNLYPFNPTELIGGVGYVWHCHIVDHEDNEMMRPYVLGLTRQIP